MNMTKTQHEAEKNLDEATTCYLKKILESVAKWGLICDTGERKWSAGICSYQIVWESVPGKLPSDWFRTSLLRAAERCAMTAVSAREAHAAMPPMRGFRRVRL